MIKRVQKYFSNPRQKNFVNIVRFFKSRRLTKFLMTFVGSSLYRNSIFLMASSLAVAFFGFIFWVINARLFSPHEVGIATTLVTTSGFISGFSLLGLKNGLIRYLPKSKTKNEKVNTGFNIVAAISIVLSIIFVLMTSIIARDLGFLKYNILYFFFFAIFVASFSINQIQEGIFVAYRSTVHILTKNILWGLSKLILPFILITSGSYGIFSSYSLGSIISLIFGFVLLSKKFDWKYSSSIDKTTLIEVGRFSMTNYLGMFLAEVPYFVLPLLIISKLGADEAAFYYIAMQIAGILLIIPSAVNQSLFAEGSHEEENLRTHLVHSIKFTFVLLIPVIVLILIFGKYILLIFGSHYSENAHMFLQIVAVSGLFIGINQIGNALVHVENKVKIYVYLNLLSSILIIGLGYFLLSYGLRGVGFAFLIGHAVNSLVYFLLLRRRLLYKSSYI